MKFQVVAALVTLFPALGWACAAYDFCLCTNTDGSFNEAATKATCGDYAGNLDTFNDGRHFCAARSYAVGEAGPVVLDYNNCRFRQLCQKHGATGDSDCWSKE
ncbi:hypothetical protein ASPZODRAFT_146932 [Penicilliopsis zonata CBS 506.65]|uniref:Extracellular membrane protein CFEM domain-containing protein n=1 Tax=Penicilliopsis zonata CBS 506.65 TaxID=1073090 RepID=A0A1L9S6K3_9EURO|nr:hypothetical protein ASPZODRAFT_146932 [Penicilliopsis zonata CBS 506.65]OJJ42760.1 hypothetical protein ASPZODRAFT_146932 [Penicilliopsis zonata CBS 506.65]